MSVYICKDHDYFWPVGVCSVVVADDEHEAKELLSAALHERGLDETKPFTLQVIDIYAKKAHIILDGEY